MTYYNYGNAFFQNIDTLETLTFDTSGLKHNENFMSWDTKSNITP